MGDYGGIGKTSLVLLASLLAALLLPVGIASVIICALGRKEADYNAEVARALFADDGWPPSLSIETDQYYAEMRVRLEDLKAAWTDLHKDDPYWKAEDHEEEGLLMRVCFYVLFYKNDREFEDEDYASFAQIFDGADTVNAAFWQLESCYGGFGDGEQRAVRDCIFLVTTGEVPPPEADVSPAFGRWNAAVDFGWSRLPGNGDGPEAVRLARSRLGDPYSSERRGTGRYVDCSWLAKWCWAGVGVTLPGTAAEQAKQLREQGRCVPLSDLRAGDLIFWSYGPSGRYKNVTHVGISDGDGRVIHASWSAGKVVESRLSDVDKIVLCARPCESDYN